MKKIAVVLFTLLVICMLTSCSNTSPNDETTNLPLDNVVFDETTLKQIPVSVTEYNFGDKLYTSPYGRTMPYSIRGIIAYPEAAGTYPLILITHGSHSNDDESLRFDTGFSYLVSSLAEQGFIVASMDMSKPYIWKYGDNDDREKSVAVAHEHIEHLQSINEGKLTLPNLDLQGKIDMSKIGLIGHSRGGETIHDIAIAERQYNINITSLLSIAPTQMFDRAWLNDTHSAMIVPEYDGDVISLDGFAAYDLISDFKPKSVSVVQLMKANHNYFNANINRNDADFANVENATNDQLTLEQQQDFLVKFSIDYFNRTLKEDTSVFSFSENQPNKIYNYDVSVIYQHHQSTKVAGSSAQMDTMASGLTLKQVTDSWYYLDDEVIIDTLTYGDDVYKHRMLSHIEWQDRNGKLSIPLSETNLSTYKSISLRMVNDAANTLTPKDKAQSFTIEVIDQDDNSTRLILPENLNALAYYPGEIQTTDIFEDVATNWTRPTPLAMINIPLSYFSNLNIEAIKAINLHFDQSEQGAIYLDSIWLN